LNQFGNIFIIHYRFILKQKKSNINIKANEKVKLMNKMEEYLLFMQPNWETNGNRESQEIFVELESIFLAEEEFDHHAVSFALHFNSWEADGHRYLERFNEETTIKIVKKSLLVSVKCNFKIKKLSKRIWFDSIKLKWKVKKLLLIICIIMKVTSILKWIDEEEK
jgi:protein involved in ribonucleotide reduction